MCFYGCAVHFDAINTPVPVMMNANTSTPYTVVTHFTFHQDLSAVFLHRLIGSGKPDVQAMLEKQLRATPGDAIINLQIHGETEVGDFLLPIVIGIAGAFIFPPFSFFIYEPFLFDLKTYTVEGDIIVYTAVSSKPMPLQQKIDPMTGLPVEQQKKIEFDPDTGLPKK